MASMVGSLLRRANRQDKPLNILTFATHESYQSNLGKLPHKFYLIDGPNLKKWNNSFRQLPKNHMIIKDGRIPEDLEMDAIWSQNKGAHWHIVQQLSQALHLPIVSLEHCLPTVEDPRYLAQHQSMKGHLNLFISEYSRAKWGWKENEAQVIHHGINTDLFKPNPNIEREKKCLSVVNDWKNRDLQCGFNFWQKASQGLPVKVLGDTPGVSQAAKSLGELVSAYQSSSVFLNTSLISPIPTSLMEAASAGCACVSTNNCMIPEIFEHGKTALLTNDENEMRRYAQQLLNEPELARKLGDAARQTILDRFGEEQHLKKWNEYFTQTANIVYGG